MKKQEKCVKVRSCAIRILYNVYINDRNLFDEVMKYLKGLKKDEIRYSDVVRALAKITEKDEKQIRRDYPLKRPDKDFIKKCEKLIV